MPNCGEAERNPQVTNQSLGFCEEALRKLKIHDNHKHCEAQASPYPDRPGEPNCDHYMRTGLCRYGSRCRYNHPPYAPKDTQSWKELPVREGQPDCGYFLKTGTCKYGSTCKYNHPKDRNGAGPVLLNMLGLPMRPDEKSCSYYVHYGSCKFGVACKFHHPEPTSHKTGLPMNGPAAFGSNESSVVPASMPYSGGMTVWSSSRASYISDSLVQSVQAYVPLVLCPSPGMVPAPGWNTYVGSLSPVSSSGILVSSSGILASSMAYNLRDPGELGSGAQSSLLSTTSDNLPQRPDQPECRYFMNNGTCKYGSDCKYHHPRERMVPFLTSMASPYGLPSRPGQVVCPNYTAYGLCKFGPTCRFDHPLLGYSYGYGLSFPPYPSFDASLTSYSRLSETGFPSETPLSPSSKLLGRVLKPDDARSKCQNVEMTGKTSDHSPDQPNLLPPHSLLHERGDALPSHSSSDSLEPSHD